MITRRMAAWTAWAAAFAGAAAAQELPLERDADFRLLDYAGYSSGSGYDNGLYAHVGDPDDPDGFFIDRQRAARMTFDYGGFEAFDGLLFVQQVATAHIFDLATDRMRPRRIGVFDTKLRLRSGATPEMAKFVSGTAMQFVRRGDVLFVSGEHYLIAVNIAVPSHPVEISRMEVFDRLHPIGCLALSGDTLLAAGRPEINTPEELAVIDVSDPAAMSVVSRTEVQNVTSLHVNGGIVYMFAGHTLHTYTVSPDWRFELVHSLPFVPLVESWETVNDPYAGEYYHQYPLVGRMKERDGRLHILTRHHHVGSYYEADISDPLSPVALPHDARDYAYVIHGDGVDYPLSVPSGHDMAVAGDRVYTTDMILQSFDADPGRREVEYHERGRTVTGMALAADGPYVYGTSMWYFTENPDAPGGRLGGLWMHDSRDPDSPIVTLPVHFFDVVAGDRRTIPGGTTNGKNLFVRDWVNILSMDISDMGRIEPVGRTDRRNVLLNALNRPIPMDVSGDTLYALTESGHFDFVITVIDANNVHQSATAPLAPHPYHYWSHGSRDTSLPYLDACGNLLFVSYTDFPDVDGIVSMDFTDRARPRVMQDLRLPRLTRYHGGWTSPYSALNDKTHKITYRDGYVYSKRGSFFVVDARNSRQMRVSAAISPHTFGGVDHEETFSTHRAFVDFALSRDKLFVTRGRYTHETDVTEYFLEEYSLDDPGRPRFVRIVELPGAPSSYREFLPFGERIYSMSGLDSPLDSLTIFDPRGRVLAGGMLQGEDLISRSHPAHIPFGATGLILRYGVTSYEVPGAVRPIPRPARPHVRVGRSGGRVEVPIENLAPGPMKWYAHDDPDARLWCALWGRDSGEEDEALIVDVGRNFTNAPRRALFHLYVPGAVDSPVVVEIVQGPFPGLLSVSPNEVSIGANRWVLPVTVSTTGETDVAWEATASEDWISFPEGAEGVGSGTINVTIAANSQLLDREAQVFFGSDDLALDAGTTLVVRQSGRVFGGSVVAADVQAVINAVLRGERRLELDVNEDAVINAADVQMTVNAALGAFSPAS